MSRLVPRGHTVRFGRFKVTETQRRLLAVLEKTPGELIDYRIICAGESDQTVCYGLLRNLAERGIITYSKGDFMIPRPLNAPAAQPSNPATQPTATNKKDGGEPHV